MAKYTDEEAQRALDKIFGKVDEEEVRADAPKRKDAPERERRWSGVMPTNWCGSVNFDISPWPLMGCMLDALRTASDRMEALRVQVEKEAEALDRARKRYEFEMERLRSLNGMDRPAHWLILSCDRKIPIGKREKFRNIRLGEPMADEELEGIEEPWNYITVGDTVSEMFYRNDVIPALAIYDGKTLRADTTIFSSLVEGREKSEICNPPGMLTIELFKDISRKVTNLGGLIHVDGEEDLAVLPCIALAPEGYTVVYGDPGKGMLKVEVNDATRSRAIELMDEMECLKDRKNVTIYKEMKKKLEGDE